MNAHRRLDRLEQQFGRSDERENVRGTPLQRAWLADRSLAECEVMSEVLDHLAAAGALDELPGEIVVEYHRLNASWEAYAKEHQ